MLSVIGVTYGMKEIGRTDFVLSEFLKIVPLEVQLPLANIPTVLPVRIILVVGNFF